MNMMDLNIYDGHMNNGHARNRPKKRGNTIYNIAIFNNMNQRTLWVLLSRKREYLAGPENINNKLFNTDCVMSQVLLLLSWTAFAVGPCRCLKSEQSI